jgi:hypothetical protein
VATRFDIERAVLASDLVPGCRHLMHVLCVRIDAETGKILAAYQPSLTDLARDTGHHRRTIIRYLAVLERRGWVIRTRPPVHLARRLHQRTQYTPRIPGYPQARDGTPPGLETSGPRPRDITPRELGARSPQARGTTPRRSSGSSESSQTDAVIKAICEMTGLTISSEWAERVRAQILGNRSVRHPEAYLREVIRNAPPGTYVEHIHPPDFRDIFRKPD